MPPTTFFWSLPRHQSFHACLRRYYYDSYSTEAAIRSRRGLRMRHRWARERVRRAAHRMLREGLDEEAGAHLLLETLRRDFQASRRHAYRTAAVEGLFEHEYGIPVPDAEWKALADGAAADLRTLARSDYFRVLAESDPGDRLTTGEPLRYELRGLTVEARPDLVLKTASGLSIHEWLDPQEPALRPLGRAALAWLGAIRWKIPAEPLLLVEYVLPGGPPNEIHFSPEDLENGAELIHDSADEMRYPLADPDRDVAREADFDFTEDERRCRTCPFLGACARWR